MPSNTRKRRTGCEQCKRRKVRCDEKQPRCSRCDSRGETCTGNFSWDSWQIERPWLWAEGSHAPSQLLENDVLRHWYDSASLNMAIFHPPINPLSYQISAWLRHSKALRHTFESVAEAHRHYFVRDRLSQAICIRGLAISSLQGEVCRLQYPCPTTKAPTILRTAILSSLVLSISSGWLDSTGKDAGLEFLRGAQGLIATLAESRPEDPFAFYLFGLFIYSCAFCSFLAPVDNQISIPQTVVDLMHSEPFASCIHPVTGISSTICPLIVEAGNYYRRAVEQRASSPDLHRDLERRLCEWTPPANAPKQAQLAELANGYRAAGLLILYQSKAIDNPLTDSEQFFVMVILMRVMETIKHLPRNDPLQNWLGPLIIIAGSELPASFADERLHVERVAAQLAEWTRVPSYLQGMELVRTVWELRDSGQMISWLELMVRKEMSLAMG
ncbi:unnamed protein product [Clonostachys solani]|uniref:Zn(2)-C6 fungal-type domain-containing protein n=1 Tax=Clonostachys solani TaxID=160281 RepID=A0A9N9Z9F3_9HYPO|nr:unnamed protein product [Clonostachys solani]